MRRKFSVVFIVIGVCAACLIAQSLYRGLTSVTSTPSVPNVSVPSTPLSKGDGLKAFYAELHSLGHRPNSVEGGAVLFRKTLIEPLSCESPETVLRIYVTSAPVNLNRRNAIRQTWAAWMPANVSVAFIVGKSDADLEIAKEALRFGDLLQGDFRDSYDNLVFKSVAMLRHFASCSGRYVMKTDDDIFVNLPRLMELLDGSAGQRLQGIVGCDKRHEMGPMYRPVDDQLALARPTFVVGAGYVIDASTAVALLSGCLRAAPIPIEDMFITAKCARNIGITPKHHEGFTCGRRLSRICEMRQLITGHHVSPEYMRKIYTALTANACDR